MENHGQDCEHNLPRQDCSSLARGNFYINIPKTLKGKNVAKADAIEEEKGKKNCGCGQDPCITYGKKADAKESLEFFRKFRGVDENYQAMRNPEKAEKEDKRSAREKRMADPKKGINSPAFKEFMKQQGM